jgi:hypothetical protein
VSADLHTVAVVPSHLHEILVEMFRERPALAADLLTGPLRVALPAFDDAVVSAGDLTSIAPTEYRADVVIRLTAGGRTALAVAVEAQLRIDARKRRAWPAYVATLHARLDCPVQLLVVCPDPAVAAWCSTPIVIGNPGLVLTPMVLGPDRIPVVTDPHEARQHPELAVLSALAHGGRPDQRHIFNALLAALNTIDHDHAGLYSDVVFGVLPAAAREYKEVFMHAIARKYGYQSEVARALFAQGEATGEARAVLAVLDARGVDVPEKVRDEITACADPDLLETWVRRAATATTIDDLFA